MTNFGNTFVPGGGGALTGSADGWLAVDSVWSYSSADSPTFVISANKDLTKIISVGQRIKLTQTTTKYFIVTAVGVYSGGATLITVYGGTDYNLANAAITDPCYSREKAPFGFPTSPAKWTVTLTDTTFRGKVNPVQNTVYYADLGSMNLSMPIGAWRAKFTAAVWAYNATSGSTGIIASLSTSTSAVDPNMQFGALLNVATGTGFWGGSVEKLITVTSKTTRYVVAYTPYANLSSIYLYNDILTLTVTFECAYL
jgi:hypothetical protein